MILRFLRLFLQFRDVEYQLDYETRRHGILSDEYREDSKKWCDLNQSLLADHSSIQKEVSRVVGMYQDGLREIETQKLALASLQGELSAAKAIADFFALRTFQRTIFEKQPIAAPSNVEPGTVGRTMKTMRQRQQEMQETMDEKNRILEESTQYGATGRQQADLNTQSAA